MNPTIETLLALQELTGRASQPLAKNQQAPIAQLRSKLALPVLVYFDGRMARGRPVVARVRNGVCLACHLRLPVGTAASLVAAPGLTACENCGSYLMLVPDEGSLLSEASGSSRVKVRRMIRRKAPAKIVDTAQEITPSETSAAPIPELVSA